MFDVGPDFVMGPSTYWTFAAGLKRRARADLTSKNERLGVRYCRLVLYTCRSNIKDGCPAKFTFSSVPLLQLPGE